MKKVLIITDLCYASPRIPGLCKYLAEFGWSATILTATIGNMPHERLVSPKGYARVIEVPYRDIASFWKGIVGLKRNDSVHAKFEPKMAQKKSLLKSFLYQLFKLGGAILAYPDVMRSWRKPAINAAQQLLAAEKFDVILSSSFPVTSHRIAMYLNKTQQIPWLADLRDLWTQNHNYLYRWRKLFETRLEKQTLTCANMFSTVSESLSLKLRQRYQIKPVSVINNGFDPELINQPAVPLTNEFTITYTGLTYQGKQDPGKFFAALRELIAEGKMDPAVVRVRIYGVIKPWITELAAAHQVEHLVVQHGPILRDHVLTKQRESQLLLLYGWEDEYETGVLPIKMFEYFAACRPIIATGGTRQEQFREIFDLADVGYHAIDVAEIKQILQHYYHEYQQTGAVAYHGKAAEIEKYSHREMAKKFSSALDATIHQFQHIAADN